MNPARARERLVDRRTQVMLDLDELAEQVDADLMEEDTADRLREIYTQELAEIDEALESFADAVEEDATPQDMAQEDGTLVDGMPVRGFSLRGVLGAVLILLALTSLIVWAGSRPDPEEASIDESVSMATGSTGALDFASMSTQQLEDALASFPQSWEVRLTLADRHLAEGDQQGALEHYLVVATGEAPPQERSRALARVGYLSYATGQYEAARESLMESLDLNGANTEAMLYLGYVLMNGLGDPASAIPYFEKVIDDPHMPPEIVADVRDKLTEARRSQG